MTLDSSSRSVLEQRCEVDRGSLTGTTGRPINRDISRIPFPCLLSILMSMHSSCVFMPTSSVDIFTGKVGQFYCAANTSLFRNSPKAMPCYPPRASLNK